MCNVDIRIATIFGYPYCYVLIMCTFYTYILIVEYHMCSIVWRELRIGCPEFSKSPDDVSLYVE